MSEDLDLRGVIAKKGPPDTMLLTYFVGALYVDSGGDYCWSMAYPEESDFTLLVGMIERTKSDLLVRLGDVARGEPED